MWGAMRRLGGVIPPRPPVADLSAGGAFAAALKRNDAFRALHAAIDDVANWCYQNGAKSLVTPVSEARRRTGRQESTRDPDIGQLYTLLHARETNTASRLRRDVQRALTAHPAIDTHSCLPAIRHYVLERWGGEKLTASLVQRFIDSIVVEHGVNAGQARCLTLTVVAEMISPNTRGDASSALPANVFRTKGQMWQVRFNHGQEFLLAPSRGAAYLHMLLSRPGQPISAIEMAYRVSREHQQYALGDAGEASDTEALATYKARLTELDEDIEQAKQDADIGRQEGLEAEKESLLKELRRAEGLGGRLRKAIDDRERIRKSVGNAIRRVVKEITKHDQNMARHLAEPYLRCGRNPCYFPGTPLVWETTNLI
jgi:hypothetical protein